MNKLAGDIQVGDLEGQGALASPTDAPGDFAMIISTTVAILTVVAAIWFLFLLITGGIGIMTAGGDKSAYENSRKRITNALIGLVIVVAAVFIIEVVALVIGIPDILNISQIIADLTPS